MRIDSSPALQLHEFHMITKIFASALVLASTSLLAQTPSLTLKAATDRPDALYKAGETVTFTLEVTQDGKPLTSGKITGILSKDGVQPQPPQTLNVQDGKATIIGKLDEPGFLLLRASSGKASAMAAAGYDPLQLKPSMPVPDDFDAFWAAQKAELAKVPMKSTLTPVASAAKSVEAFDVQVDCLGNPVSGYLGRPKNAKPKSLPAILHVHGAGVRSANVGSTFWAANEGGMLSLDINAHGIPNGKPAEFYKALSEGELKGYPQFGNKDREQCYFKGMFLRLIRAIDFLAAQPEWDGKTLIVYGSSQGGFQAFAAAGLDERVTFICAGVPAGCDHTGSQANRVNGWPKIVPNDAEGKPDAAALQASRYFDCVNFATRAKCRGAAVTVGFIDTTCPPTSVYAAYNALTMTKSIHTDVLAGHTNTPAASKFMQQAALGHVRAMKK
jgi:cephalosporin-C deacetylase-like acetyl esterase